jgi:hypothetical protein
LRVLGVVLRKTNGDEPCFLSELLLDGRNLLDFAGENIGERMHLAGEA